MKRILGTMRTNFGRTVLTRWMKYYVENVKVIKVPSAASPVVEEVNDERKAKVESDERDL